LGGLLTVGGSYSSWRVNPDAPAFFNADRSWDFNRYQSAVGRGQLVGIAGAAVQIIGAVLGLAE